MMSRKHRNRKNKLRVRPEEPEEDRCPICNSKLVSVRWLGKGECPVPMDREGVYFVDPIGWKFPRKPRERS